VNCTVIQRRLLEAEQPEQPPAEIQNHLAECPDCRAWQRRLVQMERLIPQLPVPPSAAKEQFLEEMKDEGGRINARYFPSSSILHPSPFRKKERGRSKLSLAFALAASLLVFALAWWSWPHNPTAAPDIAQLEQAKLNQRLSNILFVDTPKERVLSLARLAEEIHGEARELAGNSERLEQWARFYAQLVGQHLIEQARLLPLEDRQDVLSNIAMRLAAAESEATRFETQCKATAPRSAAAFHRIALASQKGERDLQALIKG
jgi:hypothetical protein